jgi:alpha-methylacyl-CoA racemase
VLDWDEAPQHPHHVARQTYVTVHGVLQPGPAPRFLRTPAATPQAVQELSIGDVLARWGVSA